MDLPSDFIDLQTAYEKPIGTFVNLIGVVVDILPPNLVQTGQYMCTFKLLDQQTRDSIYNSNGLPIRFFRDNVECLPKVRSIGDVVLLRSIKMHAHQGQRMALANFQTGVLVFPAASIPAPAFSISFMGTRRMECFGVERDVTNLTLPQQKYVIQLKDELRSKIEQIPKVTVSEPVNKQVAPRVPLPEPIVQHRDTQSLPTAAVVERKRAAPNAPLSGPPEKKARHSSSFGAKFKLISELRHMMFADVCVQVVKKYINGYGSCELYVTDYTTNHDMWYYSPPEEDGETGRDGDMFGYSGGPPKRAFPGPYGWLVMKVNVKEPHASFISSNINEGDMVLLRNVKMKVMKEGAKLEGDMWPDSANPDKIQVRKLTHPDHPEIAELNIRKEKYWATRKPPKPVEQTDDPSRKMTKKEAKKEKKERQQKKKEERRGAAAAAQSTDGVIGMTRNDMNKHVRCSHQEVLTTSIGDILDAANIRHTNTLPDGRTYTMPFINAKYRARVRVVDYEPKALEDFAVAANPDDDVEMSPIDTAYSASPKLEWFFTLTLEDARAASPGTSPEKVDVHVHHEDAQFLLGDLDDPADLRTNPQMLAKLREKLFTLWGNLEEKGATAPLSNRAFECCIAEYGVEMDDDDPQKALVPFGWKRFYRMFETTIL